MHLPAGLPFFLQKGAASSKSLAGRQTAATSTTRDAWATAASVYDRDPTKKSRQNGGKHRGKKNKPGGASRVKKRAGKWEKRHSGKKENRDGKKKKWTYEKAS